jgi:Flp pilus assembly protein TadD
MPLIALILAVITVIAFWGVLGNQFIRFDDDTYITANPNVQTGLTSRNLLWAFNVGYCGNWHPLTWISHMLDCRLFGLNPRGHHAVNLAFHVLNVLLLFFVLVRMTKSGWKSALVAALFAVHPLHVESVAWAAERKDVLSAFFWMLAMGAYVLYAERPSAGRYLAVMILFALGLTAKPMLVTLPLALLLLDYWPLGRLTFGKPAPKGSRSLRALAIEKIPLFVLCAGSAVITFIAQQRKEAVSSLDLIPLGVRIENALVSYASYIVKMLVPRNLAPLYPHPVAALPVWQVAGASLLLAAMTFFVIKARRSRPYLLVGWLWYIVTLIPVIGLVQVGGQAMADRYTYVPLIGLFIMGIWGMGDGETRGRGDTGARRLGMAAAAVVLGALIIGTRIQVGYWHDEVSLFSHTLRSTRSNYVIHNSLGLALSEQGRSEEAIAEFQKALEIAPNYVSALLDLGIEVWKQGKTDEAITLFKKAISVNPGYSDSYFNLGTAYDSQGDYPAAVAQYTKALELNPMNLEAHVNLGNILAHSGSYEEALKHYRTVLSVNPLQIEARVNLATSLLKLGDRQAAIEQYLEAIRIKPDYAIAHGNLAVIYYYVGRYADAWREIRIAQSYGFSADPRFLEHLSQKMPEPGR